MFDQLVFHNAMHQRLARHGVYVGIGGPPGRRRDGRIVGRCFVRALGTLRNNAATPVLVHVMQNQSENQHFLINRLAARELGEIGDPMAVEPMIGALFQFAPNSAPEFEPLRDLHWFKNLDVRSLLKLPTGQAHAAFRDASDPSWSDHAQWLWLRDTVIDPGGKTLTAL